MHGARDGDPLRLPAGQPLPADAELQVGVDAVGRRERERASDERVVGIRDAERHVGADRARHEPGPLPRPGDLGRERRARRGGVDLADPADGALCGQLAEDRLEEGRLARAARPGDRRDASAREGRGEPGQHGTVAA